MLYKKHESKCSWTEKVSHKYTLYETHSSESINHVLIAYFEQAWNRYHLHLILTHYYIYTHILSVALREFSSQIH